MTAKIHTAELCLTPASWPFTIEKMNNFPAGTNQYSWAGTYPNGLGPLVTNTGASSNDVVVNVNGAPCFQKALNAQYITLVDGRTYVYTGGKTIFTDSNGFPIDTTIIDGFATAPFTNGTFLIDIMEIELLIFPMAKLFLVKI